jgi:hypothetical protein
VHSPAGHGAAGWRRNGDSNLESGVYFGLDPIGARIWQLMADGKPLAGICDAMQVEFEVERDVLEGDILRLAGELLNQGWIIYHLSNVINMIQAALGKNRLDIGKLGI